MRTIVAGLGVQGHKRKHHSGADFVASVDPINLDADYRDIVDVPLDSYDSVLICVPDQQKEAIIHYALSKQKNVLVEKPLFLPDIKSLMNIQDLARTNHATFYTAYNHRFEPHIVRMNELIRSGVLGKIYSCRMFYGNGTAQIVRESIWRDYGAGVLPDLGSHLLDICNFWFDSTISGFNLSSVHRHENKAPDHVIISSENSQPRIELEMTLCMWRNHFTCDILAENGSAHIDSLCKWGPSTFTHRVRSFPSGRPVEAKITLVQDDPTWYAEYKYFKKLVKSNQDADLAQDIRLQTTLNSLIAIVK